MKKRSFFDVQSPALEPVWLRTAIVTACGIWGLMELSRGAFFWAIVFGGVGNLLGTLAGAMTLGIANKLL